MAKIWTPERKEEAFARICAELCVGKSLVSICSADDMPSTVTVYAWLDEDADLANRYTRARETQAHYLASEIIDIADEALDGSGFANLEDDEDISNHAAALRLTLEQRKQKIDARKWAASKLNPKVYGERLNLDGDLKVSIPDDQLDARLAHLVGKAGIAGLIGREGTAESEAEAIHPLPGFRPSKARSLP